MSSFSPRENQTITRINVEVRETSNSLNPQREFRGANYVSTSKPDGTALEDSDFTRELTLNQSTSSLTPVRHSDAAWKRFTLNFVISLSSLLVLLLLLRGVMLLAGFKNACPNQPKEYVQHQHTHKDKYE